MKDIKVQYIVYSCRLVPEATNMTSNVRWVAD